MSIISREVVRVSCSWVQVREPDKSTISRLIALADGLLRFCKLDCRFSFKGEQTNKLTALQTIVDEEDVFASIFPAQCYIKHCSDWLWIYPIASRGSLFPIDNTALEIEKELSWGSRPMSILRIASRWEPGPFWLTLLEYPAILYSKINSNVIWMYSFLLPSAFSSMCKLQWSNQRARDTLCLWVLGRHIVPSYSS